MAKVVVGLAGLARHGKDTAARMLVSGGFKSVAFADPVREGLQLISPLVDARDLVDSWLPRWLRLVARYRPLGDIMVEYGWEVAKALPEARGYIQRYGTEAGRGIHGDDCWVRHMRKRLLLPHTNVVVTDVRFQNELDLIHEFGGRVYYVFNPARGVASGAHSTEQLDPDTCDAFLLNSGSKQQLQKKLLAKVSEDFGDDLKLEKTTLLSARRVSLG